MEQDATEGQGPEPAAESGAATQSAGTAPEHGAGGAVEMAKEKLEEVKEKLGPKIEEAKEKLGPKVEEAKEKLGPKVEEAGKKVQPTLAKLKGMLQQLLGRFRKQPPAA
jgi:predicted nuclease with TOPRIM domain